MAELRFPVEIDDKQASKDLQKLQQNIIRTGRELEKMSQTKLDLGAQLKDAQANLDGTTAKVKQLRAQLAEYQSLARNLGSDPKKNIMAITGQGQVKNQLGEAETLLKQQTATVADLKAKYDAISGSISTQTVQLQEMESGAGKLAKMIELAREQAQAEAAAQEAARVATEEQAQAEAAAAEKAAQIKDAMDSAANKLSVAAKKVLLFGVGARTASALMHKLKDVTIEAVKSFAQNDPETSASIENLKTALAGLKASWGAAFAPVLNAVVPILQTLISWLTSAVNAVARFFAILGGKSSYKQAVNGTKKLAGGLGGVAEQAKEAKKQLMGIDDLTVMDDNTASGSGGGGGGGISGAEQEYIDVPIDAGDVWKQRLGPIRESIADLGEAFGRLKNSAGAKWIWDFLKGLGSTALDIGIDLIADWLKVFADVVDYTAAVLNGDFPAAWEAWKNSIADSVEMVIHPLETLSAYLNDTFIQTTKAPQWLKDIFSYSFDDFKNDVVSAWEWCKKYLNDQAICAWLKKVLWDEGILAAIEDIKPLFTKTMEGLDQIEQWFNTNVSPWFTGAKWEQLGRTAMEKLTGAIKSKWDALMSWWRSLVLPEFHIKRPSLSWVGEFSLNPLRVPYLDISWYAKGGIVDGATLIGAGEQGKEAIIPLERNTEWIRSVAVDLFKMLFDDNILADIADRISNIPTALDRMTAQLANIGNIPMPAVAMGTVVPPNATSGGYAYSALESKIDALLDKLNSGGTVGRIEPSDIYIGKRKVGEVMYEYIEERNRGRGK